MVNFWDSSALVPLIVDTEKGRSVTPHPVRTQNLIVWWGTEIECASAFARMAPEGAAAEAVHAALLNLEALLLECRIVAPTNELKHTAMRVLRLHPLRAADAMQLAAALVASDGRPSAVNFVTLDHRLGLAAQKEGFRVIGSEL